ncbi:hypothetical protein GTO10_06150 [Candidatus Saccharibacteria bacterium]|nr:hypothetical protein [Candidatus Saccharibacteria bacterium]
MIANLSSSIVGLDDAMLIGLAVFILILIVVAAAFLYFSGVLHSTEEGLSQRAGAKALDESIEELRKIAREYPGHTLGQEARRFLGEWDEMQDRIRKMEGQERRKFLSDLHYARVKPILERFAEEERRQEI